MPPVRPLLKAILWTLIIVLPFIVGTFFLDPDQMTEVVATLALLACGFAVYRWWKTAVRVYMNGASQPHEHGILGIVVLCIFYAGARIYNVAYVRMGRPELLTEWFTAPSLNYGVAVGIALFALATRLDGEKPGKLTALVTGAVTALAVFFSALWPTLVTKGSAISRFFANLF